MLKGEKRRERSSYAIKVPCAYEFQSRRTTRAQFSNNKSTKVPRCWYRKGEATEPCHQIRKFTYSSVASLCQQTTIRYVKN
ncbi:hypothetical protein OUZ56_019041 [Daphnia magna]|uniref:Uncharacterized protein n=1 Tax=Daphnia magna TaxID=35525 RepID=A0ABQ9ZAG3_9CRUS|nr:hypothetical protein OUZ56_019041 [Daphnia magna]